jgi:hypothetical protein
MAVIQSVPGTARDPKRTPHSRATALAGAGGGRRPSDGKKLMPAGLRTFRDRPVTSGRTPGPQCIPSEHGERPVSYYNNQTTPQQSLSS